MSRSAVHVGANFRSVLVSSISVFLQTLIDDVLQFWRQVGIQTNERHWRPFENLLKMTPELSPQNGRVPVAISYSTTPKEKRSVRESKSLTRTCPATYRRRYPTCCRD